MILEVALRLTSPLLGELKPDHEGKRRFKRTGNMIHVNVAEWQEKFALAARQIGVDFDRTTVQPMEKYRAASVHLYRRCYNRVNFEIFESFRKGTILTLEFLVREDLKRSPTPVELKTMLMVIGQYEGISQWGNKFGFGRFEVLTVSPKDFAHAHDNTTVVQRGSGDREPDTLHQKIASVPAQEPGAN